ncbi:GOLPH3/VPS74 family protein [Solwaraspora sp. WMMB335]|uniref:GOLPH3/VPS74 family protein n=1 Tax=Solwaraspora sp. WMMB335 TaxID=3404118 RepID=UPI003B92379F
MTTYRTHTPPRRSAAASPPPPPSGPPRPVAGRQLADEYFLIAHHDVTGRLLTTPRAAGLGLAAALLTDLTWAGAITVTAAGTLTTTDPTTAVDPWGQTVLGWVAAEPGHPASTWLPVLAGHARRTVAHRLTTRGVVRPRTARRLLRRHTTYSPADMNTAAWSWARITTRLRRHEPLDPFDTCLARLCVDTGLTGQICDTTTADVHRRLDRLVTDVPPQVDALLRHLAAAAGRAVLAGRA